MGKKNMNKKIVVGVVAILVVVGIFMFGSFTGKAVDENAQKVVIGMNNWVYEPYVIKVKAGVPVEISLDDSVRGCFRDLVIPEMGVRKYLKTSSDVLRVTFEEGEYTYACSMFMGQGKIVAE